MVLLYRYMFLQIQFQSGVEKNAVENDLRGFGKVDAMDVWFSIFWQMRMYERFGDAHLELNI